MGKWISSKESTEKILPEEADLHLEKSILPEEADLHLEKSILPEEADLHLEKSILPEEADLQLEESFLPEEAEMGEWIISKGVTEKILVRLPAYDLVGYKLVCKQWLSLISSPEFMSNHFSHAMSGDHCLFLHHASYRPYLSDPPGPFTSVMYCLAQNTAVVGSANGLICIVANTRSWDLSGDDIWILNPATGLSRKLPLPTKSPFDYFTDSVSFVFWWDDSTGNGSDGLYKVVKILNKLEENRMVASLWVSDSPEAWDDIPVSFDGCYFHHPHMVTGCDVVVEDVAYWIVFECIDSCIVDGVDLYVMRLDLRTLSLEVIPFTPHFMSPKSLSIHLSQRENSYLFVANWKGIFSLVEKDDEMNRRYKVWTVDGKGVWCLAASFGVDFEIRRCLNIVNGKSVFVIEYNGSRWESRISIASIGAGEGGGKLIEDFEEGLDVDSVHGFVASFVSIKGFRPAFEHYPRLRLIWPYPSAVEMSGNYERIKEVPHVSEDLEKTESKKDLKKAEGSSRKIVPHTIEKILADFFQSDGWKKIEEEEKKKAGGAENLRRFGEEKKARGGGETSEFQRTGVGRQGGPQYSIQQPQQEGGYQRGGGGPQYSTQQPQQGGGYQRGGGGIRGRGPPRGGYGGRSGGGMAPQEYHGGPSDYQQYQRPSRPPAPELLQSTHVPYQAAGPSQPIHYGRPAETHSRGSTSQPPEPTLSEVSEQVQKLALQSVLTPSQEMQPASSKSVRFPLRPGKGQKGIKCIVKANHFFVELPDKDLHQYDVSITPEVASRGVNRAVLKQLVNLYKESLLGNRQPVYDGRKSLYTAGALPFVSKDFRITLTDEEEGPGGSRREREFRVVIKFAARADLHHLGMFLQGKQADAPQEALQVLDIVLRELPTNKLCPVGRSFYSPNVGKTQPLGDGLESWCGFYQSIRPTQMGLSLNIDMSSTAFIEALPVIDFVIQLLNRDVCGRPLSDADRVKIKKALRGLKVEVTHRGNMRSKYRISGLTSQTTRELTFPVDERGTMKSVVDYFRETYGFVIQNTQWPCLQVGNTQKPIYLPMEVCKIVKGQRFSKRLNEKQITALLKVTCQRPHQRQIDINQTVRLNAYQEDPYANEFGMKIRDDMAQVNARVLPAPRLKYHDSGREKDCLPQVGQWNMMNKKMVNGGSVHNWICINFARNIQDNAAHSFCYELAQMCNISGMAFNPDSILPVLTGQPDQVERVLKSRFHEVETKLKQTGKELDLLIFILPDNNGSLYGDLKRICETDLGIVSQCCLAKHVYRMSKQYLANVALKINVKAGGRNTVLVDAISRSMPLISDQPTIIFGADVTHPHPGEDSSPSIAAVVASQDWPEITKYAGLVCAQTHRQELIQDLYKTWQDPVKGTMHGGMIMELLISFHRATGQKPTRIIFYRDGVSEGQFYQVLLYELDAIRKACAALEPNYQPTVTFVVVQKRHHTRLFANNHNDKRSVDKSGNILPGTVVDSEICHPTGFDFYLCSHAGIQGTSRPAHYHVLWDENKFTADALQTLTNNLCYTYARCTRSVSIVPPAYYAHLAAFRARFYLEPETSDCDSMESGAGCSAGVYAAVKPLPQLRDNVKRVMFYC